MPKALRTETYVILVSIAGCVHKSAIRVMRRIGLPHSWVGDVALAIACSNADMVDRLRKCYLGNAKTESVPWLILAVHTLCSVCS